MFAEGIPYIYYGTEQGYTTDREPLWHSGYSKEHPLWLFLRISVAYRKEAKVRTHTHTRICAGFKRGLLCATKLGRASHVTRLQSQLLGSVSHPVSCCKEVFKVAVSAAITIYCWLCWGC